ncbi:MAG: Ig-like domain-containing protein [Pirellulales bacterium]
MRLGGYDTSGRAYDVAVVGTVAYVADEAAGIQMIDVTNPRVPVPLGGYDTSGVAFGVAVLGTVALVAEDTAGLAIIDVKSPAAPVRLGGYDTSGQASGLAVSGTLAYVADGNAGLVIIGLSPVAPPPAPDLQAASDTGISNTDNTTADTTPTFDLSVPSGSYFRFYRDGVVIGDYQTGATYTTPPQPDGTYNYTVAAVDNAGNVSPQSPPLAVTVDTRPPAVAGVLIGGSSWTGGNAGGYSIPVGSGQQLAPLPWANVNQIKVVFSENVLVDKADLTLSGVNVAQYDLSGAAFSYQPGTFTATWTLASALAADKLEIRLNADAAGFIQDPIARRLDGEWTNPASPADTGTDTYPSGNGTAGGNFVFRFRVLPCDANQDGSVDIFDVANVQVNYGQTGGMSPAEGDFDGNGTVDIFDVALLQVAYGRTLEPPAPMPAAAPGAGSTRSPLVAARPGHSPAQSSQIAESFGGRVSGPPEEHLTPSVRSTEGEHLARSARSTARRSDENVKPPKCSVSPFPRALAVRHAVEAAWASAVDEVLGAREG